MGREVRRELEDEGEIVGAEEREWEDKWEWEIWREVAKEFEIGEKERVGPEENEGAGRSDGQRQEEEGAVWGQCPSQRREELEEEVPLLMGRSEAPPERHEEVQMKGR